MRSTSPRRDEPPVLTPRLLLHAYAIGVFPMADPEEDDRIAWYAPDPRAILPLDRFRISRSLARIIRSGRFDLRSDQDFEAVIRACAAPRNDGPLTWISEEIVDAYVGLHAQGHAHSIEAYHGDRLVGGLYGVTLGAAFFGESMFHTEPDASKVALVHLIQHLRRRGYALLDIQVLTPHLQRFGAIEVSRSTYEGLLKRALRTEATWESF